LGSHIGLPRVFKLTKGGNHAHYYKSILLCGLTIILLLLIGCGATKIGDIQNDLDKFKKQQVTLSGEVVEVLSLPFIHKGAYQLADGTGKLWVIPSGDIPARGEKVKVTGTVEAGVEIAGKHLGAVLMEEK